MNDGHLIYALVEFVSLPSYEVVLTRDNDTQVMDNYLCLVC